MKSFLKTCAILQQFVDLIAGAGEEEEEKQLTFCCGFVTSLNGKLITYFVLLQVATDQCYSQSPEKGGNEQDCVTASMRCWLLIDRVNRFQ